MATTSPGEYLVRGLKISLKLLQEVANDLPPPAASVVGVAQQIIEILDVRFRSARAGGPHADGHYHTASQEEQGGFQSNQRSHPRTLTRHLDGFEDEVCWEEERHHPRRFQTKC